MRSGRDGEGGSGGLTFPEKVRSVSVGEWPVRSKSSSCVEHVNLKMARRMQKRLPRGGEA